MSINPCFVVSYTLEPIQCRNKAKRPENCSDCSNLVPVSVGWRMKWCWPVKRPGIPNRRPSQERCSLGANVWMVGLKVMPFLKKKEAIELGDRLNLFRFGRKMAIWKIVAGAGCVCAYLNFYLQVLW